MILHDLFESRMSELDIEYQDYKNLEPVAFYSRYKMSKDDWASKHWSLIKSSETVHEEEVEEGLRDPKDNPCWKGYKPVGTKQKGGRTVPNCVPKE